jgi:hypothetical protein
MMARSAKGASSTVARNPIPSTMIALWQGLHMPRGFMISSPQIMHGPCKDRQGGIPMHTHKKAPKIRLHPVCWSITPRQHCHRLRQPTQQMLSAGLRHAVSCCTNKRW